MKKQFLALALLAAAPMLASCMTSQETAVASAKPAADDDAYCRANAGEPGSSAYVACRKDRDVGAIRTDARMEQAHRNLAESMLNGH
ncbi:MAG: hypothetical protein EKK40_08370 [Bradyrhizobiaceae bacterium]|nr:MAG: hypothetical protein EKK40_08370 [Bradyrhizobiaceae bacterium]